MNAIEWSTIITLVLVAPVFLLWFNIYHEKRWPLPGVRLSARRTPSAGFVGDFDQFRKCTTCDWCDQASTATRDRHICPKCGASTSVAVGRWVLEGNGPIRFEERHP